jgi:hypothetical protein
VLECGDKLTSNIEYLLNGLYDFEVYIICLAIVSDARSWVADELV